MHNDPDTLLRIVRSRQQEDHRWAEQQRLARAVRRRPERLPRLGRIRIRVGRPIRIRPAVRLGENG